MGRLTFLPTLRRMHISSLPMRWGAGDNYCYIITDSSSSASTVIDPASPPEVVPTLEKQERSGSVKLTSITNTHHHYDHSDGNPVFRTMYPKLPIVAGKDSPLVSETPKDGANYSIGKLKVTAIHTPCHTQDSICYYVEDLSNGERAVFTGDTLFNAGCGRFFEGTPAQMLSSLKKLANLPKDTLVYPGHEYTKSNAKFARTVLENDAIKRLVEYCNTHEKTTGVFSIGDELEHNPFMRCEDKELQAKLGVDGAVEAMAKLREMKNSF